MMMNVQEKNVEACTPESASRDADPQPAAELIRLYGKNSLAFFGLAPGNMHFLAPGGVGVVIYRLVSNVAVVLGDPVCAPAAFAQVTRSFLDYCARQRWRVAFYQASPEHLASYRALKLRTFKMGEEAILRPQNFTLHGSALANVRTSTRRAARAGVSIEWFDGVPPTAVMQQLAYISCAWLKHKAGEENREMGFSTGRLDELIESATQAERAAALLLTAHGSPTTTPRFVTALARTSEGVACAFVTFTPIYGSLEVEATTTGVRSQVQGWGWSVDLMRRSPDSPPGVMELLLVRALERASSCGAQIVNLGMVALADSAQELSTWQRRLAAFVTARLHLLERRQTLFSFKQKFHPCWQSRYLVTDATLALPQVALAVLRLRNYSGGALSRLLCAANGRER